MHTTALAATSARPLDPVPRSTSPHSSGASAGDAPSFATLLDRSAPPPPQQLRARAAPTAARAPQRADPSPAPAAAAPPKTGSPTPPTAAPASQAKPDSTSPERSDAVRERVDASRDDAAASAADADSAAARAGTAPARRTTDGADEAAPATAVGAVWLPWLAAPPPEPIPTDAPGTALDDPLDGGALTAVAGAHDLLRPAADAQSQGPARRAEPGARTGATHEGPTTRHAAAADAAAAALKAASGADPGLRSATHEAAAAFALDRSTTKPVGLTPANGSTPDLAALSAALAPPGMAAGAWSRDGLGARPALPLAAPVGSPEFAPALALSLGRLAREGVHEARLQLQPAEMGPIDVQITVMGAQARVDFTADVAATRAAIEAGLPELAGALREAGLTLSGGGVFQQAQGRPAAPQQTHREGRREAATDDAGGPLVPTATLRRVAGVVDLYA